MRLIFKCVEHTYRSRSARFPRKLCSRSARVSVLRESDPRLKKLCPLQLSASHPLVDSVGKEPKHPGPSVLRQNIAPESIFGVQRVSLSSDGIELLMRFVARLHLSMLPARLEHDDFSKDGQSCWFVGFCTDNGLNKEDAAPLLQVSRIGVTTGADALSLASPCTRDAVVRVLPRPYQLVQVVIKRETRTLGLHLAQFPRLVTQSTLK